jgi:hypothetical protein
LRHTKHLLSADRLSADRLSADRLLRGGQLRATGDLLPGHLLWTDLLLRTALCPRQPSGPLR